MADNSNTQQQNGIDLYQGESFAIARVAPTDLAEMWEANLGEEDIGVHSLPRVGMPGSGGLSWQVPDPMTGEPQSVNEIEGIVLATGKRRALWFERFEDSDGGPPQCSSEDGRTGLGAITPEELKAGKQITRPCKTCPMNQWGSATPRPGENPEDVKGKACAERTVLMVLQRDTILPMVVSLAPSSIKPWKEFMIAMTRNMVPLHDAVVGLGLRQEAKGKIKYSVVKPRVIGRLDEKHRESVAEARKTAQALLDSVTAHDAADADLVDADA